MMSTITGVMLIAWNANSQPAAPSPDPQINVAQKVHSAVETGQLAFRLTTPAELKALLGTPQKEHREKDGESSVLLLEYSGIQAVFTHFAESSPYTLFQLSLDGKPLDIGKDKPLALRNLGDLAKLDSFWGVANVSLTRLDLNGELARLDRLPFDSRTTWPEPARLPPGFHPTTLLEDGKNPGLGVRALHAKGIDGRGIHIAIIDQPLLRDHREYKARIVEYREMEVQNIPPQMHGSPVTSIAVGKTCGTAPEASVHYYAVPMWKWSNEHCKPYAAALDQILEQNKNVRSADKIRVVSVSLGMFSSWPDAELWTTAVRRAAAEGVLVVTCDPAFYKLALLKRQPGQEPESPGGYVNQFGFGYSRNSLGVPVGNRATASYSGPEDYVFWREGGMSWAVPYLAGVAALGFQTDPQLKPKDIPGLWIQTAFSTPTGLVINPSRFIEAVRAGEATKNPGS